MSLTPDYIERTIAHVLPKGKTRLTHRFKQIEHLETLLSRRKITGDFFDAYHAGDHAWLQARDHPAHKLGFIEVSEYREIKRPRSVLFEFTIRLTLRGRKALKVAKKLGHWCTTRHRLDPVATTEAAMAVLDQPSFWQSWAHTILSIEHYRLRHIQGEIVREMMKRMTHEVGGKTVFVK